MKPATSAIRPGPFDAVVSTPVSTAGCSAAGFKTPVLQGFQTAIDAPAPLKLGVAKHLTVDAAGDMTNVTSNA
ncbi:MAG TPA: hypothetical protein VN113_06555 [Caulobacter sp.]|nr:hypothetical protein [Caulobacter sp.]